MSCDYFKCCGFAFPMSKQDISMAIDTFQFLECLHEDDTQTVMALNSIVLVYPSTMRGAGRGEGERRKRQKRSCHLKRNYAYSCFTSCPTTVRKCCSKSLLSHWEYRQVLAWISWLTLFSSRTMECTEHSSSAFFC